MRNEPEIASQRPTSWLAGKYVVSSQCISTISLYIELICSSSPAVPAEQFLLPFVYYLRLLLFTDVVSIASCSCGFQRFGAGCPRLLHFIPP